MLDMMRKENPNYARCVYGPTGHVWKTRQGSIPCMCALSPALFEVKQCVRCGMLNGATWRDVGHEEPTP